MDSYSFVYPIARRSAIVTLLALLLANAFTLPLLIFMLHLNKGQIFSYEFIVFPEAIVVAWVVWFVVMLIEKIRVGKP